jgi:hypothetical protein
MELLDDAFEEVLLSVTQYTGILQGDDTPLGGTTTPAARAGLVLWAQVALQGVPPTAPAALIPILSTAVSRNDGPLTSHVLHQTLAPWADMIGAAFQWTDAERATFAADLAALPATD